MHSITIRQIDEHCVMIRTEVGQKDFTLEKVKKHDMLFGVDIVVFKGLVSCVSPPLLSVKRFLSTMLSDLYYNKAKTTKRIWFQISSCALTIFLITLKMVGIII